MRYPRLTVPLLVSLGLIGSGCGTAEDPTIKPETDPVASNSFELILPDTTTAATVIPAIVETGHEQLATACGTSPVASVRIFNPLVPGSYEDVACSTILGAEPSVEETTEALMRGDEPIAQAQQDLTPVGLLCGLFTIGVGLAATWSCDKYPDRWCPWPAAVGTSGISLACMFL